MGQDSLDIYHLKHILMDTFCVHVSMVIFLRIVKALIFLRHDVRGKLCRINWGHFQRDSFLDAEIDQVEEIYDAMRSFDDIINDPANHIKLKMQPGDMVTVMNKRMLHGRSELQGGQSSRHIQCGYMDWDEIVSTMRVLRGSKASK